jgi:hypothetical protein
LSAARIVSFVCAMINLPFEFAAFLDRLSFVTTAPMFVHFAVLPSNYSHDGA